MSSEDKSFTVWGFIKGIGKLLIGLVILLQAVVGLVLMLLFVSVLVGVSTPRDVAGVVPDGAALVLAPQGVLVEQREEIDPFLAFTQSAYGASSPPEIEVRDFIDVIRAAKDDDRISALVLDLQNLFVPGSAASKLHYIAGELRAFRDSGKPIVAVGDFYEQGQYMLAAEADEILLNPIGGVFISGYGQYNTYLKSAIEKLEVTANVFKVGTYKSAVEPYMRDDMSDEAKEANLAYLSVLWNNYVSSVAAARDLDASAIIRFAGEADKVLRASGGDTAKAALNEGFVDALKTRKAQQDYLIDLAGEGDDGRVLSVGMYDYLEDVRSYDDGADANVGIVTAAGTIVDGEQPAGTAGGDTIARLLQQAREDDEVQAVVLRVDSPGGSAFASEIIRQEILELKEAGKPVVVSMGSLAASGGYWISANADEIWAAPDTITGSIGIFGVFPTFEKTLSNIGITTDGVGTTPFAGAFDATRALSPETADYIQQTVEDGYESFISIVADGREMTPQRVDEIAQGRVWIGETALQLGLVDNLGYLDDATAAAAALAGLEDYDVVRVREQVSPFDELFSMFMIRVNAFLPERSDASALRKAARFIDEQLSFIEEFNDPKGAYVRCLACDFE